MSQIMSTGLAQAFVGLIIVFIVLILLWGLLEFMRVIFSKKEKSASNMKNDSIEVDAFIPAQKPSVTDEGELIAVLTAAIAASLNTSTYNLNIKSYKRLGSSAPNWNRAGITDTINSRI